MGSNPGYLLKSFLLHEGYKKSIFFWFCDEKETEKKREEMAEN